MDIPEFRKFTAIAAALLIAGAATADPIVITPIAGSDDGGDVGGYSMTDVTDTSLTRQADNATDCIDSPISGEICFTGQNGSASDLEVQSSPSWWQFNPEDVFVTNLNWIEILLPANTRAVSLWVGASFQGQAWVQASDGSYTTLREHFSVGSGTTSGYGFHTSPGNCTAITKIIIEPQDWGFGNLSINQGSCTQVPEPGPLVLLLAGLLGMGLTRKNGGPAVESTS